MTPSVDYVMTCIGAQIAPGEQSAPSQIEKIYKLLLKKKCAIYKTKKMAGYGLHAVAIFFTANEPHDAATLTKTFAPIWEESGIDIIVQERAAYDRGKRLVVMDLDSTLVTSEGIDELAKEAGVGDQVVLITKRAMNGEIPFSEALRARVRLLKGLSVSSLETVYQRTHLTPGALEFAEMLNKNGFKSAVLSGGFDYFAERIKEKLNLTYAFSNQLEIKNGVLTGEVTGEIVDGAKKLTHMLAIAQKEQIALEDVVAVGDGANDLPMITNAGLGIAFNAKPSVRKAAPCNITQKSLASILFVLGISEEHP
ncbi:MAG: phosphoserine phosphatase SerB [Nitrospirota bacterium]